MYCVKVGKKYVTRTGSRTENINQAYKLLTLKDCAIFMSRKLNEGEITNSQIIDVESGIEENLDNESNFKKDALEQFDDLKDIYSDVKSMYKLALKVKLNKDGIERQLKDSDLEVCDIYHFIELNNLDACSGYKVYKKLHDALKKRRTLKDINSVINSIEDIFTNENIDRLSEIINSNYERNYRPRILEDIFDK